MFIAGVIQGMDKLWYFHTVEAHRKLKQVICQASVIFSVIFSMIEILKTKDEIKPRFQTMSYIL